jgi:hypothetical protein
MDSASSIDLGSRDQASREIFRKQGGHPSGRGRLSTSYQLKHQRQFEQLKAYCSIAVRWKHSALVYLNVGGTLLTLVVTQISFLGTPEALMPSPDMSDNKVSLTSPQLESTSRSELHSPTSFSLP